MGTGSTMQESPSSDAPTQAQLKEIGFGQAFTASALRTQRRTLSLVGASSTSCALACVQHKRKIDDTHYYDIDCPGAKRRKHTVMQQHPSIGNGRWGKVYASSLKTVLKVQKDHTADAQNLSAYVMENYVHAVLTLHPKCKQFVPKLYRIFVERVATGDDINDSSESSDSDDDDDSSFSDDSVESCASSGSPPRSPGTDISAPTSDGARISSDDTRRLNLYSHLEKLHATGQHLLDALPDWGAPKWRARNEQSIVSYVAQIAHALQTLQNTYRFDHCDLLTSNTMYQRTRSRTFTVNGVQLPTCGMRHKLIDFGFSSLEIGGKRIMSAAFQQTMDFEFVHKPERDMMQLLYFIVRYNWKKLSPHLLHYMCNLLTVVRDAVNLFGFIAVPECVCFWKNLHKDAVYYRRHDEKCIRVRKWGDLYNAVGQATFYNSKTTPNSILKDITACISRDESGRTRYDTIALSALRSAVSRNTVDKYFKRKK